MIHRKKTALFISVLFVATPLFANTTTEATPTKQPPPYGDNPNIFKVIGYKTKEKLTNTANRIDRAAQRGVEKVKPKVEQTVENTKDFTEETANKAAAGIERTATKAKEAVLGNPNDQAPIVQRSLSQSSSNQDLVTTSAPIEAPMAASEPITQNNATPITNTTTEPAHSPQDESSNDDSSSIPR